MKNRSERKRGNYVGEDGMGRRARTGRGTAVILPTQHSTTQHNTEQHITAKESIGKHMHRHSHVDINIDTKVK